MADPRLSLGREAEARVRDLFDELDLAGGFAVGTVLGGPPARDALAARQRARGPVLAVEPDPAPRRGRPAPGRGAARGAGAGAPPPPGTSWPPACASAGPSWRWSPSRPSCGPCPSV